MFFLSSFLIMIRAHIRTNCNSSDAILYVIETQYITTTFFSSSKCNNSHFHTLTAIKLPSHSAGSHAERKHTNSIFVFSGSLFFVVVAVVECYSRVAHCGIPHSVMNLTATTHFYCFGSKVHLHSEYIIQ